LKTKKDNLRRALKNSLPVQKKEKGEPGEKKEKRSWKFRATEKKKMGTKKKRSSPRGKRRKPVSRVWGFSSKSF